MASVRELAELHLTREAELDPVGATDRGLLGYDAGMTDYSPDGIEARTELARQTLNALREPSVTVSGDDDRRCAEFLAERLDVRLALADAGEMLRAVRILASPIQDIREVFDLMSRETPEDWEVIATRMEKVPAAVSGVQATLTEGLRVGVVAARRQALACAVQAVTWSGQDGSEPFFAGIARSAPAARIDLGSRLVTRLDEAAEHAGAAYAGLATFLQNDYAPRAAEADAVGDARYQLNARYFLGTEIDVDETYEWGWEELRRIEKDMAATAELVAPGGSVADAVHILETDPDRAIEGAEPFRLWLQDLMDATIADLDGTHFDIPGPLRHVEAMIAPPGGAAAMYYTGPSEDFSRPGRTWYPTSGKTRFPLWNEMSTAYHEGVPGHHLQVAQVVYLGDRLSSYQRASFVSGHGEGWALYAERLMDELGYFRKPDYRLGLLAAHALRAARVVLDIGMHLEYRIPQGETFHPGERWTPELGETFLCERAHSLPAFVSSEIVRYLGWPGQAISYKVGERVWLEARDDARRRHGDAFDLKRFHADALDLGPLGLDLLRRELAAL